jgi:hypothetical protein
LPIELIYLLYFIIKQGTPHGSPVLFPEKFCSCLKKLYLCRNKNYKYGKDETMELAGSDSLLGVVGTDGDVV